jgi:peptidoglycan/xylan/chitin deacetylase (PgdA/CDA1 family)
VFLYHGITNQSKRKCSTRERQYWISELQFRDQLDSIRAAACDVTRLGDLDDSRTVDLSKKKTVVITFDDGRSSDYEVAFPVLLAAQMSAHFFINPAYVGGVGFLTWQQVAEMQRAGMSFQSHGYEHVDLVRLSVREMERQMKLSKWILEDKLGESVDFLSLPYGRTSHEVIRIAIASGYAKVCTSRNWPSRPGSIVVNRVGVYSKTTAREFDRLLAGKPLDYALRNVRAAILFFPKLAASRLGWLQNGADMMGNVL